jgi:hypothetical protein
VDVVLVSAVACDKKVDLQNWISHGVEDFTLLESTAGEKLMFRLDSYTPPRLLSQIGA